MRNWPPLSAHILKLTSPRYLSTHAGAHSSPRPETLIGSTRFTAFSTKRPANAACAVLGRPDRVGHAERKVGRDQWRPGEWQEHRVDPVGATPRDPQDQRR